MTLDEMAKRFNPLEPRDWHGRWTRTGFLRDALEGGGGGMPKGGKSKPGKVRLRGAKPSGHAHRDQERSQGQGQGGRMKDLLGPAPDTKEVTYRRPGLSAPSDPSGYPYGHTFDVVQSNGTVRRYKIVEVMPGARMVEVTAGAYNQVKGQKTFRPRGKSSKLRMTMEALALLSSKGQVQKRFNPRQPRDWHGRWIDAGDHVEGKKYRLKHVAPGTKHAKVMRGDDGEVLHFNSQEEAWTHTRGMAGQFHMEEWVEPGTPPSRYERDQARLAASRRRKRPILKRFNPNQPRWPKGSGDKSGEWIDVPGDPLKRLVARLKEQNDKIVDEPYHGLKSPNGLVDIPGVYRGPDRRTRPSDPNHKGLRTRAGDKPFTQAVGNSTLDLARRIAAKNPNPNPAPKVEAKVSTYKGKAALRWASQTGGVSWTDEVTDIRGEGKAASYALKGDTRRGFHIEVLTGPVPAGPDGLLVDPNGSAVKYVERQDAQDAAREYDEWLAKVQGK